MRLSSGSTSSHSELNKTPLGPSGSFSLLYFPAAGSEGLVWLTHIARSAAPRANMSRNWEHGASNLCVPQGTSFTRSPERIPRHSGEYPMNWTPSSLHVSTRPDVSGTRLSRLYWTWLLTSGTPRFCR